MSIPTNLEVHNLCEVQLSILSCSIDIDYWNSNAKLVYTLTNIAGNAIKIYTN